MKKQAMYIRYGDKNPIGAMHFTNCFGVLIYEPDEFDKYDCDLVCCWCSTDSKYGFHRHQIHYTTSGRDYIRKGSLRIYLDEIMRV